jgi:RNA polymerase sigma factor (sigma-70 family)
MQDKQTVGCADDMPVQTGEPPVIDIAALYRTHHKHVLLFVRRYVRDAADAEDVTQSAFLEATRCAATFSNLSKPSTWLFGIALNMARSYARKKGAGEVFCDIEEEGSEVQDPFGDPARIVEARELLNKSIDLVNTLSEDQQATFKAVMYSDQTYDLAARELGVPIGTVRSRLSRIRGELRALTESRVAAAPRRSLM